MLATHDPNSQSHTHWDCTYHIVFCPKYRRKRIYEQLCNHLGRILNKLLQEMKIEKVEWTLKTDHVHLILKIPPKEAVSDVVGRLKWKSAIRLANEFSKQKNWYINKSFWSTGYFVRTIGIDAEVVKKYVRDQADKDKREDGNQLDLGF